MAQTRYNTIINARCNSLLVACQTGDVHFILAMIGV